MMRWKRKRLAFMVLAAALVIMPAGQRCLRGQPSQGAANIQLGEFPPDFELPILTLEKDDNGKPFGRVSENETFRLSSFRDKRPVCLWMSSYT